MFTKHLPNWAGVRNIFLSWPDWQRHFGISCSASPTPLFQNLFFFWSDLIQSFERFVIGCFWGFPYFCPLQFWHLYNIQEHAGGWWIYLVKILVFRDCVDLMTPMFMLNTAIFYRFCQEFSPRFCAPPKKSLSRPLFISKRLFSFPFSRAYFSEVRARSEFMKRTCNWNHPPFCAKGPLIRTANNDMYYVIDLENVGWPKGGEWLSGGMHVCQLV